MKKIFGFLTVLVATFALAACGENDGESRASLDFRSIYHIDSSTILSLGDSFSVFEKVLGTPVRTSYNVRAFGNTEHRFELANSNIAVTFYNDEAVMISMSNPRSSYVDIEFSEMDFGMTRVDLENNFYARNVTEDATTFVQHYDSNGRNSDNEDSAYYTALINFVHERRREEVIAITIINAEWWTGVLAEIRGNN